MDKRPDLWERFEPAGPDAELAREIDLERNPPPKKLVFDCRTAEEGDLPALTEIVNQAKAYLKEQGLGQWQSGYPEEEDFALDIQAGTGWLFTCEGEPAGYICIERQPVPGYDCLEEGALPAGDVPYASVHRLMAGEAYRGTGLAREMMGLAEDLAMGYGCGSVRVDTHEGNRPIIGLLRSLGYRECGIMRLAADTTEAGQLRTVFEKPLWEDAQ